MNLRVSNRLRCAAIGACLVLLGGCHKTPAVDAPHEAAKPTNGPRADGAPGADAGVTLSAEQVQKMGIVVSAARAASHTPEAAGYALIVPHEGLAQGVADLAAALAEERLSAAVLARDRSLAGTPGAMPADALESAVRQAAVDRTAAQLARRRLSALLGQSPPWKDDGESMLEALGSGRIKLVRATFPLGAIEGPAPANLRLARINGVPSGGGWRAGPLWDAPADASVPGRSFFALLKGSDAAEGERLLAWAPLGASESGVAIPSSAVLLSEDKAWCYVQRKPGLFVRSEIDITRPLAQGYFVKSGIAVGDQIVTESAGLLLAREMNPSAAAD